MKILLIPLIALLLLQACGGGSGSNESAQALSNTTNTTATTDTINERNNSSVSNDTTTNPVLDEEGINTIETTNTTQNEDAPLVQNEISPKIIQTQQEASRFLNQATFGASSLDADTLIGKTRSSWLKNEFDKNISYHLPLIEGYQKQIGIDAQSIAFWKNAITAEDQLRQRMAFALSQIFVISDATSDELELPGTLGYYMDILTRNAFGNYRDLLEEITYSPAMGHYLTYMYNEKADAETGQRPDENYAREIMQLFSIGLLELNLDGSLKTDSEGNSIETYTNQDIKGLAKVFTGLVLDESKVIYLGETNSSEEQYNVEPAWTTPMIIEEEIHSVNEKSFLGYTIPANTQTKQSITLALDHLASHNNVAPFISRQLIQRLTTSHPSAAYIQRVATAFKLGSFTLEDGTKVGTSQAGDLKATLAAILLDEEATSTTNSTSFGKIKEPILRFTQWSRAFELKKIAPEYIEILYDTSESSLLNQHPLRAPSVFNFYRPGYIAPKTLSGNAKMTVPELQITNATSIVGYANFMSHFIFAWGRDEENIEDAQELFSTGFDEQTFKESFKPTYKTELALVSKPNELIEHLNTLLCDGRLQESTQKSIVETISFLPIESDEDKFFCVGFAIFMVMNSPEFLVQS